MSKHIITRREFLRISSTAVAGAALAACAKTATEAPVATPTKAPAATSTPQPAPAKDMESPMLTDLVAGGKLLPIEERLPQEPLVWDFKDVRAFEKEEGRYGGTLRFGHRNDIAGLATIGFARIAADRSEYFPDMAKSWESSPDFMSITFHVRKGMKWSDGEPYTADDLLFWWEEIIHSPYLEAPMGIGGMNTNTDQIVKVDDYTFRIDFAEPNPLFLLRSRGLEGGEPSHMMRNAAHYIKTLHPDYTPDSSFSDKKEQFRKKIQDTLNIFRSIEDPNRPVMWAWHPLEYKEGQLARLERNAYFWSLDRQGRQLPNIDTIEDFMLADADAEVIKLKLIAQETHFERRKTSVADMPLLRENEEKGNYDIILNVKPEGSQQGFIFNTYHVDPDVRAILDQADFRRALSIAIDREAINQTAYYGLGKSGHGFSAPNVYDPEIDGKWAEFDLNKASQMLDSIGLDKLDDEGFRTLPSGDKFTFVLLFTPGWHPGGNEAAEIATEGWTAIKLRSIAKALDGKTRSETQASGDYGAWVNPWVGGVWDQNLRYGDGMSRVAPEQAKWWQAKDKPEAERPGVAPVGKMREVFELEDTILTTIDEEERQATLHKRRQIIADQCWCLGMVQNLPHVIVASKRLRGVWGRTDEMQWYNGAGDEDYWPRSWFFSE